MKKILSFVLKLLVSAVFLYFFLSRMDIHAVVDTLKQTKVPLFLLSFFVYLSLIFVSTKRWSLFLPEILKYSKLLSLYFIGSFFNTLIPGLVSGDAVKAYYLYRHTGKGSGGVSLASVFMDRYMGLAALVGIGFATFIIGYPHIKGTQILWLIPILVGGFLLASLILWKINWGKIKALSSFYAPLMEYKQRKEIIYKGLLLGFIIQLIGITCVYILSLSIGINVPIFYFFMFVPIINVVSSVPISFAGLGIREAGFVILFGNIAVIKEEALSLSLLIFIVMCLVSLLGGIEYLRVGKPPEKEKS
ncbi:MAG: flippase-like domain-containing protein [Nitrospirae bacterium]|nr:flippase-like domain-containing protein [Nitrospirota bacterium]